MNRDDYLFGLKERYAEEIYEAYLECEHKSGREVDFPKLNEMLTKLNRSALVEGLSAEDFEELVRAELPDISSQLKYKGNRAA